MNIPFMNIDDEILNLADGDEKAWLILQELVCLQPEIDPENIHGSKFPVLSLKTLGVNGHDIVVMQAIFDNDPCEVYAALVALEFEIIHPNRLLEDIRCGRRRPEYENMVVQVQRMYAEFACDATQSQSPQARPGLHP